MTPFDLTRRTLILTLVLMSCLLLGSGGALAAARVGQPAPDFTATDTSGRTWRLAELAGQPLVLEWSNHECPYVIKHYASGNMQALQREATAAGYLWLTVISSAPGKQGHVSGEEADALTASRDAAPSAVLLDPDGSLGRAYGATTTPHMFIVDGAGAIVYMGGIDDRPTTDQADVAAARNHVRAALADLASGQAVSTPATRPYGCSVKY